MTKFKKLRIKLGFSQEKLARELSISTSMVINLEREPSERIMKKMEKLKNTFGVLKSKPSKGAK